ncbi:alpha/beta hydrolase [Saccharopolyspora erythraea]|uniref:alpha/beta fold hydrolase n=1 Tax=Saccharopolyspora erythraea TaxID=1836 RepID=UPI001BABA2A1|nr:alpha/beta hydrolase [Saccharopolyspora erythraea]QUH03460.1 alpha/beta hydrolase [Saccharopolyspora erythraea]
MGAIYRSAAGRDAVVRWCNDQLDRWPLPHTRRELSVRDAPTHVVTAGNGDRTVVFVPGTNFAAATCLPIATALSAHSRVVIADLPGQPGLSSGERRPADGRLEWYGGWLSELVERTAKGPATVMGHSLGAAIALCCRSHRVERQVLVSPGGLTRLRITPAVAWASACWLLRRSRAASARLLRVMHGPGREPRPALVDWMALLAEHVRPSLDPGVVPAPPDAVPRTVVVGEHDVFLPRRVLAPAAREILGVEPETVPSAGHLVVDEFPERLAAIAVG